MYFIDRLIVFITLMLVIIITIYTCPDNKTIHLILCHSLFVDISGLCYDGKVRKPNEMKIN